MVHRRTILKALEGQCFFSLLSHSGLDPFVSIGENVYEEAIKFYMPILSAPPFQKVLNLFSSPTS